MKKTIRIFAAGVAVLAAAAAGYVAYAYLTYYRLPDHQALTVENNAGRQAEAGKPYTLVSYNIGFGAYSPDYSFFMDGGKYSRAFSRDAVLTNINGAMETVAAQTPDFAFLQEVDTDSTRSYHVDELQLVRDKLPAFGSVYAQDYDSPYLLWPLTSPHGKSRSGLATLSTCAADGAVRRSLPVETGFSKFYDLDRCYSVTRIPVKNGKVLCLYNVHLSAYTTDGSIATEQVRMLLGDMSAEYEAGSYVVCGGDFNKDLLGDSSRIFGVEGDQYTWAQSFPFDLIPDGFSLEAPLDPAKPVASCRNADRPYDPKTDFQLTIDGFIVSGNVKVLRSSVIDTGFSWSDHNPVYLRFSLQE